MYKFLCVLVGFFTRLIFRIKVTGEENIPKDGGAIICANHLSNWDPVVLQISVNRRIYYMAKAELFKAFFVGFVLKCIKAIPVKRTGSDLTAIKQSFKTIKDGNVLGIFPTGQRQKVKGEGEVKAGVGLIAGKTGAPVIPVHIESSFKWFSKVKITIGEPKVYKAPEGEKINVELAEEFSKDIYNKIKSL
ncbi:MAG: 1-acyl-sn-glycerol-3-phosphate acyltransferase [Clostridia bacterium]|nr:1-acyl-sn-glycerol-3-phosphate acyltransferase [Clostridia bacterium]